MSEQKNKEINAQVVTDSPKIEEMEKKKEQEVSNNEHKLLQDVEKNIAQTSTEPARTEEIVKQETEIFNDLKRILKENEKIIALAVIEPPKIEEINKVCNEAQKLLEENEKLTAQVIAEPPKVEEIVHKKEPELVTDAPKKEEIVNKEPEVCNNVQKLLQEKDEKLNQIQLESYGMNEKINKLQRDLEVRTEERENYKNKIDSLESEITELKKQQPNTLSPAQQNEVEKIKKRSEDMLTKAKGIIFDKTKICKNQELQIEALSQQVSSLKDVLSITKDLLEIRNIEVKHLQEKMECMDLKINAEKQRQDLMHKKMDALGSLNDTLKEEYQKQLVMFEEMQIKYENN